MVIFPLKFDLHCFKSLSLLLIEFLIPNVIYGFDISFISFYLIFCEVYNLSNNSFNKCKIKRR